ncbi:hypothetical protein HDU88_002508 [Geranomyces variabilis]|nr:hypothetical protein HDU88_002508 [Geranomyces variabilis]
MHTAQYESYDSLLSTVSQRVKSALGQQHRVSAKKPKRDGAPVTRSLPRRKVVIPGARAMLFDDDDDDDDDNDGHDGYYESRDGAGADDDWASEDTLGWESADSASLPDEPLVKFRNLSFDLVPIDETPLDPIIAAPAPRTTAATPHSLRRTIAQLEAEFTSELDKSSMLVDLQYRYMRRRLAHGNGDSSSSATADILSILMEMVRAQTGVALSAEDEESDNAVAGGGLSSAAEEDADDEVEESLLDRLREHLERPEYSRGGGLAAVASGDAQLLSETMVSERSRDFGRFIPTAVPRFGINLHEREE